LIDTIIGWLDCGTGKLISSSSSVSGGGGRGGAVSRGRGGLGGAWSTSHTHQIHVNLNTSSSTAHRVFTSCSQFSGTLYASLSLLTAIFHVNLGLPVPEHLYSGFYWS